MSDTPLGRFCWYELLTTDLEGAQDFYRQVTGWETGPWEGEGPPYITWINDGTHIGGVMTLPDNALANNVPPHWLPYISTPDVDATAERAAALGGVLHHRFDLPDIGRLAVLADPGGAVFTAYEPSDITPGHDGPAAVGEVSWHELISTDWEVSWPFYAELFGWEEMGRMDMGAHGTYHMYGREGVRLGGMMTRAEEMPPPCWFLYIRVPDVHASVAVIEGLGGRIVTQPMQVPNEGGHILHGIDPQGAGFALHTP